MVLLSAIETTIAKVQCRKETSLAPIHWVGSVDSDERAATCECENLPCSRQEVPLRNKNLQLGDADACLLAATDVSARAIYHGF